MDRKTDTDDYDLLERPLSLKEAVAHLGVSERYFLIIRKRYARSIEVCEWRGRKGGRVVCGGIHMSDIPGFPYADLWEERSIRSVANLTRADGEAFFPLALEAGVKRETVPYPLERANDALDDLRTGRLQGAAVLVP